MRLSEYSQQRFGWPIGLVAMEIPGNQVRISLRTASDVNLAVVCEQFGGGGHPKAAGFVIPQRIFWKKWVSGKEFYLPNNPSLNN